MKVLEGNIEKVEIGRIALICSSDVPDDGWIVDDWGRRSMITFLTDGNWEDFLTDSESENIIEGGRSIRFKRSETCHARGMVQN